MKVNLCGEKVIEALPPSQPLVSFTSSAKLLLLYPLLFSDRLSPRLLVLTSPCRLWPELLLLILLRILLRPLGFVAIGCRLLDALSHCFDHPIIILAIIVVGCPVTLF